MNAPAGNRYHYKGIEGLGGWLAILQIFLFVSIVPMLLQLLISNSAMNGEYWSVFGVETSEHYVPEWRDYVRYGVGSSLLQLGALLYVLLMFYGKKRYLPVIMIVYFVLALLLDAGDLWLLSRAREALELVNLTEVAAVQPTETDLQQAVRAVVRSVAGAAVWIPYFLRSERVANTFVR